MVKEIIIIETLLSINISILHEWQHFQISKIFASLKYAKNVEYNNFIFIFN